MNKIDFKIEEIALDKKQEYQIKYLFKMAFVSGMVFKTNLPHIEPSAKEFEALFKLFMLSSDTEMLETFNEEMKAYERKEPTELG